MPNLWNLILTFVLQRWLTKPGIACYATCERAIGRSGPHDVIYCLASCTFVRTDSVRPSKETCLHTQGENTRNSYFYLG